MAEPISIQQLKDASLDVKSLEEVVNGDENVVVTTRLGETYPSVKGSIKKVFENGGLPATPFKTKALMTASALVDGDYATVTDDTVNNGLYLKTAGAWVKSDYDPLTQAKTYTDTVKSETISIANLNASSLTNTIEESLRELKNRLGVYETSNLFNPNQASAIGRYSSGEPSDGNRYLAGLEFMKIEAGVPFWSSVTGGGLMFALYDVNKNYLGSVSTNDGVNGVYPIPKLIDNKIPYFLRASTLDNSIVNIRVGVGGIRPPSNLAYKESYKTIINQEFMGEIAQDSIIKATIETIATQVHNTPAPSTINMLLKQL